MAVTLRGLPRQIAFTVQPGAAAGAHTIDGDLDASGDVLLYVKHLSADFTTNTDITSEFSVTGYNTIDNTAGTDTTGNFILVVYAKAAAS